MTHLNMHHRRAALNRRQLGFDPATFFGNGEPTTDPIDPFPPTTVDPAPTSTSISSSSSSTSASSSTTSSSSSTTSSSSSTTTSTTTSATITTPLTTQFTTAISTKVAVATTSHSLTTSAAASSQTSAPADSTGLSTGAVVGGIGAGIVAIAAIGFAVAFFVRRAKRREDTSAFDSNRFRKSGVMLDDPPTTDDYTGHGFNPRPPTMIEKRLASPAPTFGTQHGHPGPAYNNYEVDYGPNRAGHGAGGFSAYNYNDGLSPVTANSAHPMFSATPGGYNQSPFSPIGTPVSEQGNYPSQFYDSGPPPPGFPVFTRQGSGGSTHATTPPRMNEQLRELAPPADDYVDLSRSSVSPYQAAQYAEISKRLNTDVPEGMPTPDVDRHMPDAASPPLPPKDNTSNTSPFADPSSAPPSPGVQYAVDTRNISTTSSRRLSNESTASQTLDFPVPPIPAHTVVSSSRYRIDSMPPRLPEIHVESRVSVGNYPGLRESDAPFVPGALSAGGNRFPTTPSPLASSFNMPMSPFTPGEGRFAAAAAANVPAMPAPAAAPTTAQTPHEEAHKTHAPQTSMERKRNTTYSMYDPEDAYGGF